ncbi:nucleotidyltransferase family protein [bacterium]|nr:nucleotidyltransferase family protein [FCB group bacterium]MBL7191514.1 nucleotidyltransferase family protein [bacterium]
MLKLDEIKQIIDDHRSDIEELYKVNRIGLFGSYVRGEQKDDSDLDVLVSFSEPVSLFWLVKVEIFLSEILGIKVDLVPEKDIRIELKDGILSEAVFI